MSKACQQMAEYVEQLLQNKPDQAQILAKLKGLFIALLEEQYVLDSTASQLETGLALSAQSAANCFDDIHRTLKYWRAVLQQINKLDDTQGLQLVYAGSGPFAALLLPLLPLILDKPLKISFIDAHQNSLQQLEYLIQVLEMDQCFEYHYIQHDAASYQHPAPIDLLLTETMQQALQAEGQVMITENLSQQLSKQGLVVPKCVEITASLIDVSREFAYVSQCVSNDLLPQKRELVQYRLPLGPVFLLTKDTRMQTEEIITVELNNQTMACIESGYHFALCTRLLITDDITLQEYESGLTNPYLLVLPQVFNGGELKLRYKQGEKPGFVAQL